MLTNEEIAIYESMIFNNLDFILQYFNISLNKFDKQYTGVCPIHAGADNPNGCCIYINENGLCWRCFTHNCHEKYKSTGIGLLIGLLSSQKRSPQSFGHAIGFCRKYLTNNQKSHEPKEFKVPDSISSYKLKVSRDVVRSRLSIPSPYFSTKFSKEILDLHDVGQSIKFNRRTMWRAIVPVYDDTYSFCIGCVARSIFEKCNLCNCYHDVNWKCPKPSVQYLYSKWKNVDVKLAYSLYNYWFLPKYVDKLIIVESPGNVWRLKEAGFYNCLAIYGSRKLNDYQIKLLQNKQVKHLYLGFDNDEAGRTAFQLNGKKLWELFNIHKLIIPNQYNDWADMNYNTVKSVINSQI